LISIVYRATQIIDWDNQSSLACSASEADVVFYSSRDFQAVLEAGNGQGALLSCSTFAGSIFLLAGQY
jgi:hypothetical protein